MTRRARSRHDLGPLPSRVAGAAPESGNETAEDRLTALRNAVALLQQGRLEEAEQICSAVLAADSEHCDALHLSGIIKHQQGRLVDALHLIGAALKAKPSSVDVLTNYGVILDALSRHEEALASFDRVLTLRDGDAVLHYNRGNALKGLGRNIEALASYDRALALAPGLAPAHYNRGGLLAALERNEEALTSLDQALAANPDNVLALNNRGAVLFRLKRYAESVACYDKALALRPDYAEARSNRGAALTEIGRCEEALDDFAHALRLKPDSVDAFYNRGNALLALARVEDALRSYADALALAPRDPDANFNDALARLCVGDFREGWRKYKYRWDRRRNAVERPVFDRPMWHGERNLQGKTILLVGEQGMGDAIQFVRYAPLVAALGAKVLLRVHPSLTCLMTSVPGVSHVIADGALLPDFDLYCPLMSLPEAFATELATIPGGVPYIQPPAERIAKWRQRLPQNGRLRVGICWAGSAEHANDRNRSIPLDRFAAILSVNGIDFISLQKDVREAQAAILRAHHVHQLGQDFDDFADTAAVIAMLDLVIAADTSVAHLGGAMAKAVGLLVPFAPDFRWMLQRTDTPWYPTMRLFRQGAIADWDGPLERLRQELAGVAGSGTNAAKASG
jgi:tetratricopeptide (TPR) repeat protein